MPAAVPDRVPDDGPDASGPAPGAALSADELSAAIAAVAGAFGDPTRRDIYFHVRASDGLTASEVARAFDLHPNVARHHLEKLAAGGYLTVALDRAESAGRPSKRYRASPLDTLLVFPPRRDDLLGTLLARALERLPTDEAAEMAEEVGYEYGLALARRMEPGETTRSARHAVAIVADALTAHGFAAHAERAGRSLTLVAERCPFGEAARRFPAVLCSVDRGMIRGMLAGLHGETEPEVQESLPEGADRCVTRV